MRLARILVLTPTGIAMALICATLMLTGSVIITCEDQTESDVF